MINRSLMMIVIATLLLMSCEAPSEEPETPPSSISVDIIPKTKVIEPGGIITYKMDILNIGVGKLDLAIEHQLVQLSSGKVLQTKGEILQLQNQLILERGLPVPESAEGGMYEVKTLVSAVDITDTDSFEFEVFVEQPEPEPQLQTDDKTQDQKIQFVTEILNQEMTQQELPEPTVTVTIDQWGFHPEEITINVGDVVMWVNIDKNSHTVTGPGFDSGGLRRNSFFKHQFIQSGNFPYSDTYRPAYIGGLIHVKEAS